MFISHFSCKVSSFKDTRKTINKYIPERFHELAMWSIALLINTSTWDEFVHNWKLICLVFIPLHLGIEHENNEHRDALIYKISKIRNDSNTATAIKSSETAKDENKDDLFSSNIYDYCERDDEVISIPSTHRSKTKRQKVRIIGINISQIFYSILSKIHDNYLVLFSISLIPSLNL